MFLSIFAATCRPKNVAPFLDNLRDTCDDPSSFEVLFKLDEGATNLVEIIEEYKKTSPLNIKYLETPKLEGYYTLDMGYNELLNDIHPDSYFCWLLTDEIRFETKGWDSILKKYVGFYPDDIFRIKLSIFQLKNYTDMFECLPCPDNYAVTTRRWLEIAGGWGHFWGPDSWHQCVDFYLMLSKNEFNPFGIWRSFPIYDIQVGGQEAGQGIEDPAKLKERVRRIWEGWQKHSTFGAQENYNRIAQRLNAHIYAVNKELSQYIICENLSDKTIEVKSSDGVIAYQQWGYKLPRLHFKLMSGHKHLTLPHLFPRLYLHRASMFRVLHTCRRVVGKIRHICSRLLVRSYLLFVSIFSLIVKLLILVFAGKLAHLVYVCLRFFSKIVEFILTIPSLLVKRLPLPEKTKETFLHLLELPVKTYKNIVGAIVIEPAKKMGARISTGLNKVSNFLNWLPTAPYKPMRKRFRKKTISINYLFDGKTLKQIET